MTIKPILLLASERSGTNLLRAIVSSHPKVASPPPCGVVGLLAKRAYKYLSSPDKSHMDVLISDAILATETHLNPWDMSFDRIGIRSRLKSESFWGVFQAINEAYAEYKDCDWWFSKEPNLFEYIYELALHMPTAKFVYLVRDGRDVAASMLKGGVHEHHIYYAARRWAENQRMCLTALSDPLLRDRIFMLKYEDLITSPETHGVELMEFLGLNFDSSQLDFHKSGSVLDYAGASEFWKNLAKPIDSSNQGNYRKHLSTRDIEIFESVAWQEMKMLGYLPDTSNRYSITLFDQLLFKFSNAWRRRLARIKADEEMERRKKRNAILKPVIERTFDA